MQDDPNKLDPVTAQEILRAMQKFWDQHKVITDDGVVGRVVRKTKKECDDAG
jgi:hypothetical protein